MIGLQRHLNSPEVRAALGIDASDPDSIKYTVPVDEFKKQLEIFIEDLKSAHTRKGLGECPAVFVDLLLIVARIDLAASP